MSTPTDSAAPVLAFLGAIEPRAKELPDPLSDDYTSTGKGSGRHLSMRIRGLMMQLAEEDLKITRAFEWDKGALVQKYISRGHCNSTVHDSELRELFRQAEADRSVLRERWYCGLSMQERAAFDCHCLSIAESVVQACLLSSPPGDLHGPLARLALEYAAIGRRADAIREERKTILLPRVGRAVLESVLGGIWGIEKEAKSRLIGRWFREQEDRSQDSAPAESHSPRGEWEWMTVSEAARASGANPGEISRAANKGVLKSNGKTGTERRIHAASLSFWQLRRAKRSDIVESDGAVERKVREKAGK